MSTMQSWLRSFFFFCEMVKDSILFDIITDIGQIYIYLTLLSKWIYRRGKGYNLCLLPGI